MTAPRPAWHWLLGLGLAAALFAGGMYLGTQKRPGPEAPARPPATEPAPPPAPAAQAGPKYPVESPAASDAATDAASLPMLDESDSAVLESLTGLLGGDGALDLLYPEHVVQRIVATVDNLPRAKIAPQLSPLKPASGAFAVAGTPPAVDPKNYARYDAYVRVLESVDSAKVVAWYRGFYPLFQQAYRELGYPDRYFNDRVVEVIDHLLAAPAAQGPVVLAKPEAFWVFSDPRLEALSAGQKLMLRIGPENAAKVKAKLREVRRELTGRTG